MINLVSFLLFLGEFLLIVVEVVIICIGLFVSGLILKVCIIWCKSSVNLVVWELI